MEQCKTSSQDDAQVWEKTQSVIEQSVPGESSSHEASGRFDRRVLLGVIVAALVIAGAVALVSTSGPQAAGTGTSAAGTSISNPADAIVKSTVQTSPGGFVNETSKQAPSTTSDWAVLQAPDGSEANVTVIVYPSSNASQSYFDKLVAGVKGLPGYSDISSELTSFQQYGTCYGYGEDVEGIAVVNGFCTKGNAFLQIYLVCSISFSDLEADMTVIMNALYQNAT